MHELYARQGTNIPTNWLRMLNIIEVCEMSFMHRTKSINRMRIPGQSRTLGYRGKNNTFVSSSLRNTEKAAA